MKILRIVFCTLACLCVAASVIIGALFGWIYFLALLAAAAVFGMAMFVCIRVQEKGEPSERRDFMDPPSEDDTQKKQ